MGRRLLARGWRGVTRRAAGGSGRRGGGARRLLAAWGATHVLAPEQAVHQRRGARARVPAQAQHGDLDRLAAEGQGLVTAPHVEVQQPALYCRTGVHHGVDAVELHISRGQADHRSRRQQLRVCGRDAAPHLHPGRCRRPLAVGGGAEGQLRAGLRLRVEPLLPRPIRQRRGDEGHHQGSGHHRGGGAPPIGSPSSLGSISGINCRSAEVLIPPVARSLLSRAEPAGPYPP